MQLYWVQGPLSWVAATQLDSLTHHKLWKPLDAAPYKELHDLSMKLLGYGGRKVAVPFEDLDICTPVWESGELVLSSKIKFRAMEDQECHRNAARLWNRSRDQLAIGTGFALSDDGIWRRHSWCIVGGTTLIETTESRAKYFGLQLMGEEAQGFCNSYYTDDQAVLAADRAGK